MLYRTVPPSDMRPESSTANLSMWSVVRSDEPREVIHTVVDFLRLPQRLQEVIGNAPREERPSVFVAANADRVVQFYPDDTASSQPILDVFVRERMMIIVTLLDHPRKDRFLYDYVFESRAGGSPDWRDSALICEKAPPDQGYKLGSPLRAFPGR
jgi:hypothetical protein